MLVGIVSDTHGHVHNTLNAVRMLKSMDVSAVIHCGDIGSESIPALFDAWPTHYVLGNVDGEEATLRKAIEAQGHTLHGRFGSLELSNKRIAFLHSDDAHLFRSTVSSGEWDLVCYGHTHRAEHHHEGPTLVLNPGAIYRADPHTIALVQLPELDVTSIDIG